MHQINLNLFQIVIFITFIYIFTYYWLPKQKCNDTDEYIKLLEKYNKVVDDKNRLKKELIIKNTINNQSRITIGSGVSAHSGSMTPKPVGQSDNIAVEQILH